MIYFAFAAALLAHDPRADTAVRDLLDAELLDYPSSRFREVRAWSGETPRGAEAITVCGKVNSPNAMGGFTGWKAFLVTGYWENGRWFGEPKVLINVARGAPLSEAEFVDVLVENTQLATTCSDDSAPGEPFDFDPSAQH